MKARRRIAVATSVVATAALLTACSTGSNSGDTSDDSSAAPVATALGSANAGGVPAAITAAGGTELLTTAKPEGVCLLAHESDHVRDVLIEGKAEQFSAGAKVLPAYGACKGLVLHPLCH